MSEWMNDYDVLKLRNVKERGWMGKSSWILGISKRVRTLGRVAEPEAQPKRLCTSCCAEELGLYRAFGRGWSNFLSTVTAIWVFFQMFYCVSFQSHIRVERIALMDHYAPITQLQQLATFSPSYFIYHIFFDPGQSILRQTLASCHFYLKDLDF